MRICVDAGHDGVRDCGAVGQRGCLESDITLYAALALKENLHARGHEVVMTRECNDERLNSLTLRANIANDAAADLFISLHCNAAENTAAKGMEVFTSPGETGADPFATMIYEELAAMFPDQLQRTDYSDGDPLIRRHVLQCLWKPICLRCWWKWVLLVIGRRKQSCVILNARLILQ